MKIENLLKDGKLDEAKASATTKLEEVKGIEILENKLNSVISSVDEKIANAKTEILKYYEGEYDIKYRNTEVFPKGSEVTELEGTTILNFIEDQQYGSPQEYMYRLKDGAIFQLNQGTYYWVNNNNKIIYQVVDQGTTNINNKKISSEESRQIALNYFLSRHTNVKADEVIVGMGDSIDENNEYFRPIAGANGTGKVVAEYYINASTGEVRVLWD